MSSAELGAAALLTLLPVGSMAGVSCALVFQWTGDHRAIRRALNLIVAHILEFRLFLDEPVVILRAQWGLLRANARLLRLMLVPSLILAIPSIVLVQQLNALYGKAPLRVGEAVVVSSAQPTAALHFPAEIAVETPPVHTGSEVAWRIRPAALISIDRLTRDNPGIAIPFPPARILTLHWLIWFSLTFAAAAIGAKCLL